MNVVFLICMIASSVFSALVVGSSPVIIGGESELLQPAYCLQILSVVASIGFAVVAFIFPTLAKAIDGQKDPARRAKLEKIRGELQQDVVLLFVLVVAVFIVGVLRDCDLPWIRDVLCLKEAIVSWFVLESFILSAIGIFDLVVASFGIMRIPIYDISE